MDSPQSLDFADSSLLEAIAPATSTLDLEHAFSAWDGTAENSTSMVPFIKQRLVLLFDELLPLYIVFRTSLLEDQLLKSYLARLAINLDVFAFGTAPGPDQEPKALPKELIHSQTISPSNEPTIVLHQSDDATHAYVFWRLEVVIARPLGRFHKPAIYFQPTATLKPDLTPTPRHDYLPSRVPPALNLLQSFEHDPALAGIHPRLSAMRISKIAPSAPPRELARPIRTGHRPLFRVVPPLMWRTRFAAVHSPVSDLSLLASLDVEIASYTSYAVTINTIDLELQGGTITSLSPLESVRSSPGDQLSYLYKATPDLNPDGTPTLGNKGHILTLHITASIHVAPDCTPLVKIVWKTPVDFASEAQNLLKAAHRLSAPDPEPSANRLSTTPSTNRLSTSPSTNRLSNTPSTNRLSTTPSLLLNSPLNITLTITAPPRVKVGQRFTYTLFLLNHGPPRHLSLSILPKRRDTHRPQSSSLPPTTTTTTTTTTTPLAPAVLDPNITYTLQKLSHPDTADLLCLSTEVRLGLVKTGGCATAQVAFLALVEGALGLGGVLVREDGEGGVLVRDCPGVVADA